MESRRGEPRSSSSESGVSAQCCFILITICVILVISVFLWRYAVSRQQGETRGAERQQPDVEGGHPSTPDEETKSEEQTTKSSATPTHKSESADEIADRLTTGCTSEDPDSDDRPAADYRRSRESQGKSRISPAGMSMTTMGLPSESRDSKMSRGMRQNDRFSSKDTTRDAPKMHGVTPGAP